MCDGKFLMRDRELLILDEDEIAEEAQWRLRPKVWERYTRNAEDVLQS